ncbi:NRPS protein [Diaporthe australafricana]|uniref:NRPS protein n=1 Tax=Diaporthe australafricana TaxID=127596 RepID=A0ABR3W9W0_9PEZI
MPASVGNVHLDARDFVLSAIATALDKPLTALDLGIGFIGNGGDSLSSILLQATLRKHHMQLSMHAIFTASTLLLLADSSQVREGPEFGTSLAAKSNDPSDRDEALPQDRQTRCRASDNSSSLQHLYTSRADDTTNPVRYPATEMQLCLIRSSQANPGRNVIVCIEQFQAEQIPVLKKAWKHVLGMESIFRMSFDVDQSSGWMYEKEGGIPFIWEEVDVPDEATYRREVECPPSDVGLGMNFKVVTRCQATRAEYEDGRESTVVWRVHHALMDCIAGGLLRSNVQSMLSGQMVQPGPSFPEFALQLQALQARGSAAASAFWARQTRKYPSPATNLLLPAPSGSHGAHRSDSGHFSINFDPEKITLFAKRIGVTAASLYYTAWALVMTRYIDSNCISMGAVLSGRTLPIEGVHVPEHGFSRSFSSVVNVLVEPPQLDEPHGAQGSVISDFPIQIDIHSCGRIYISYDTQVFFEEHISRLATSLFNVLDAIQKPDATVMSCLDSVVGGQQQEVLASMGNWSAESTRDTFYHDSLVSLFDRAAKMNPALVAVDHCSRVLTYAELAEQATRVAQHLTLYVRPGDVVCVHADGTPNWIVAIYAILKAGATYCPIVPAQPDAVRDRNYTVAGAKMFLTGSLTTKKIKPVSCGTCLSVEELLSSRNKPPKFATARTIQPDSIAYVCLTGGSTGVPKAVQCRHIGLVAFQTSFEVRLCARPGWRIAQFMSPAFDGSIHEIFSGLSYGATLVLKDSERPFEHLKTSNAAILTPSVAKVLHPEDFPSLQAVYLVGEAVPQGVCDGWASKFRLFNMYGPTEATCGATIKRLTALKPVTLGKPNPSTRVYVLDSQQRLVPWGGIGEIYLAGVQVAIGYAGKPNKTSKHFLPDTINPQYSGERMYKTGDRAYWDERGELVFLGRRDREIKLRGFRIDLDDLETQLKLADARCTAAAVARQGDYLVALVQPADLDLERFAAQIRSHIAIHMRPRHVLAVDSFPTNKIGKLDYNAIATTNFPAPVATSVGQLRTASELMVAVAIRDVLGLPADSDIDGEAVLSHLGIASITALSLAHRLSRSLQKRIPVRAILESATVRDLAHALATRQVPDEHLAAATLGEHGVSPIEREWWQKYQQGGGTSSFNVSYACSLPLSLDRPKLVAAWSATLGRHRILRCRYRLSETGDLVRRYAEHSPTVTLVDDIDTVHETNTPFDLRKDNDIVRVLVSPRHMLVIISHIVCDLTTLQKLLDEVAQTYKGEQLPPVRKTYMQTTWSQPALPRYLSFWADYLLDAPSCPLPLGNSGTSRKTWAGASYVCGIPVEIYEAMLDATARNKTTMHQLALAAVALALQGDDTGCDITLGAPYLNRNSQEDLGIVGLFLEPLPVRVRYPPPRALESSCSLPLASPSQDSFLVAVQQSSMAAVSHAVPWDQLLAQKMDSDLGNVLDNPIFDVMVTFHEAQHEVRFAIPGTKFVPTCGIGAKFKLMAEFSARSDGGLGLRLEYSVECFAEEDMVVLGRLIIEALRGLIADEHYHVTAGRLRDLRMERNMASG